MIGYARLVSVFTARVRALDAVSSVENPTQANDEEEEEGGKKSQHEKHNKISKHKSSGSV